MGAPKAEESIGGRTLLERAVATLAAVVPRVAVVLPYGAPRRALPHGARALADEVPDRGPLEGVRVALRAFAAEREPVHAVFVVAVDLPFLTPDVVRLILARLEGHDAAAPESGGRLHPTCAALHPRILPRVEEACAAGELAMHALLERIDLARIGAADLLAADPSGRALDNVNTPADLARARTRLQGGARGPGDADAPRR